MIWELYQMRRIGSAERQASRTQSDLDRTAYKIEHLENKVDGLALACQSLWELLRDKTALTEEDLESKMEEIDLRDGKLDGKISAAVDVCVKCGRKTTKRRANCLYCGVTVNKPEAFGSS